MGIDARTLLEGDKIFSEFKGSLTEQYVAQELVTSGIDLYYENTELLITTATHDGGSRFLKFGQNKANIVGHGPEKGGIL